MSSKIKEAQLDEAALHIAEKVLAMIETEVDKKDASVKKIKTLTEIYNTLKPFY